MSQQELCSRCRKSDEPIVLYVGEKRKPVCKKCWLKIGSSDEELG